MKSSFTIWLSLTVLAGCANEAVTPAASELVSSAEDANVAAINTASESAAEATTEPPEETPMPEESAPLKYNKLTEFEEFVIVGKGTERAFVGEYTDTEDAGTYICRRCNAALYKSDHKFHSGCGWPAFDDEIEGAVERHTDADGYRVEIVCKNCGGHLGHVFEGENLTKNNVRHCVNSVSMIFVPDGEVLPAAVPPTAE